MKPVHVLFWPHRCIDARRANVRWERSLDEDAVNASIGVKLSQLCQKLRFGGGGCQDLGLRKNSKPAAGALLHPHIDLGGRIVAHPDECETRLDSPRFECSDSL